MTMLPSVTLVVVCIALLVWKRGWAGALLATLVAAGVMLLFGRTLRGFELLMVTFALSPLVTDFLKKRRLHAPPTIEEWNARQR